MTYERHPSAANTNALVSPQYVTHPGSSVDALVSPQYQTTPSGETSPLIILGAALVAWWRADLGITLNGSNVSAWADQSGNGWHLTQGTAVNQPAFSASGGPNSQAMVNFDGTNDVLPNAALARPAPGTEPSLIFLILRQDVYANRRFCGAGVSNTLNIHQSALDPQIRMLNAANGPTNSALVVGAWGRIIGFFNNNTTDYLKIIATTVTGTNCGNNTGVGFCLGANSPGSVEADCSIAEAFIANRDLTAPEATALDAYVTSRYGAGLV